MANYLTSIKVGMNKTYHISHSGQDAYYTTSSSKKGGSLLKGIKFKNNQLINTKTNKVATEFEMANAIENSKSSGCFISTAVYSAIIEDDSCKELQLLRAWRDDVLLENPVTAKMVADYYQSCPAIADALIKHRNYRVICHEISVQYLQPIIQLIESSQNERAIELYVAMVEYVRQAVAV